MESMIHDMAERLFRDHVTHRMREDAASGQCPEALWTQIEEAGLTMALVPEDAGGFGVPPAEALGLLRIAGAHGLPLPLAETLIANAVLATANMALPGGRLTIAEGEALRLEQRGKRVHASGHLTLVPFARWASLIVTIAVLDGTDHVLSLPVKVLNVAPAQDLAGMPRDDIKLDHTLAETDAVPLPRPMGGMRQLGALIRSLAAAGAMETILEMSIQYANDRVQFGRPIGKFQAIQQQLAVLSTHVAAANVAAAHACAAADKYGEKGSARFEIAVAKIRADEAANLATGIAHQVHGAIGFTYEHSLHFATRRLWSWRAEFGSGRDWAKELGHAAIERGGAALWPFVTAR